MRPRTLAYKAVKHSRQGQGQRSIVEKLLDFVAVSQRFQESDGIVFTDGLIIQ